MLRYAIRRILIGLITLFGITVITFAIIRLAPGDPALLQADQAQDARVSARIYEQLKEQYGLDKPWYTQYGVWMWDMLRGDFGKSFHDGLPVNQKIAERMGPTLSVSAISLIAAFIISVPIGVFSAMREGGKFDRIVSTFLYMLYSVPTYVMGMVLILYLGVKFDLLPFRGIKSDNFDELSTTGQAIDYFKHGFMITFCFTFSSLAYYSRFVRQNLLEVVRQDYIRTARAKGVGERGVILRHAFTNSMIPFITLLGLTFPSLLSGSVILEQMFNWPGIGKLYIESVFMRDYSVIMALNVVTALMVLVGTLAADLAYGLVDPRVSYD